MVNRMRLLEKNIYNLRYIVCIILKIKSILVFGILCIMVFERKLVKNLDIILVMGFKVVKSVVYFFRLYDLR